MSTKSVAFGKFPVIFSFDTNAFQLVNIDVSPEDRNDVSTKVEEVVKKLRETVKSGPLMREDWVTPLASSPVYALHYKVNSAIRGISNSNRS